MIKKIVISIIVVVFLVSFFVGYSHFIGFEEWTKHTWASFNILSILNKLGIFVFVFFGLLALIKKYSSKSISRSITDNIHDLPYIIVFCTTLTFIIPFIAFKDFFGSFVWFIQQYSIISFIYIFGLTTICIKIFIAFQKTRSLKIKY